MKCMRVHSNVNGSKSRADERKGTSYTQTARDPQNAWIELAKISKECYEDQRTCMNDVLN